MYRIMFKTEASLWEMTKSGKKDWDARLDDKHDPRIVRLDDGEEVEVCLWNKETQQVLVCRLLSVQRPEWAPGWVFMQLFPVYSAQAVTAFKEVLGPYPPLLDPHGGSHD